MNSKVKIEDGKIEIDVDATRDFYLTQNEIIKDCDCADCAFYYYDFIKQPFRFLEELKSAGIDLGKNLTSEPTGVWCLIDDDKKVIHIDQVYQAKGKFLNSDESQFTTEKVENGLNVKLNFLQSKPDTIDIEVRINKIITPPNNP